MAFTLGFHIILVPFGVAFTFLTTTMLANWRGLRRGDEEAMLLAQRWSQVAAVLFAVGAVSGTVLSFEMGQLWPGLMGRYGAAWSGCSCSPTAGTSWAAMTDHRRCRGPCLTAVVLTP
jgi:cytochrome d ubiquinol oxidase subunit I